MFTQVSYRLISPLLLGLLAQFVPTLAQAQLDEVQLRLQPQLIVPLRWDNVESAPEQAGGEDPDYQRKAGMHLVKLILKPRRYRELDQACLPRMGQRLARSAPGSQLRGWPSLYAGRRIASKRLS